MSIDLEAMSLAELRNLHCVFHGRWAAIPREGGHRFHGIVGSYSTGRAV